jgi:hypothetical protein
VSVSPVNSWLSSALVATLLLRSLVAPGYMPSDSGAGFGVALCHSGMPAAAAALLGGGEHHHPHHHGHESDDSPELTSDDLCPLGEGLTAAALITPEPPSIALLPRGIRPELLKHSRLPPPGVAGYSARAPPVESS